MLSANRPRLGLCALRALPAQAGDSMADGLKRFVSAHQLNGAIGRVQEPFPDESFGVNQLDDPAGAAAVHHSRCLGHHPLIENRVGAQLVPQYAENLTPQSELDKLKAPVETFFVKRDRGTGRPTKKDRRTIEAMWSEIDYDADVPDDFDE